MLVLLASALTTHAQITFTVTATADNIPGNAAQDYIAGQAYTFVYTLTPEYPQNHNYFPGQNYAWFEKDVTTETPLFTAVGGTGMGGHYTDPIATGGSPFSFATTSNSNFIELYAGADHGNIGLTTLAGTPLSDAIACMNLGDINFATPGAYTNPANYFSAYLGNYHAWGGTVGLYRGTFVGATFQVTNVSISNQTAIPEPSTSAALLGLGVLGWALSRRVRRQGSSAPFPIEPAAVAVGGIPENSER